MASNDDEFGNYEEAPSDNSNALKISSADSKETDRINQSNAYMPAWLLDQTSEKKLADSSFIQNSTSDSERVMSLQDELNRTQKKLIEQQKSYAILHEQHQQQSSRFDELMKNLYGEFKELLKQSLLKQRELLTSEFKSLLEQQLKEQEKKSVQQMKDAMRRHEEENIENLEAKLVEYQEKLITHNESEYQDIEMKIQLLVHKMFKEEHEREKSKLKQTIDGIEKEIKTSTEKYVKNYFMSQSEFFKDQIKSGILQERLIHKDLINKKLEKLCKDSEEKRRQANMLFARHVSSLHFFVSNAEKQLGILKDVQTDLFKNKDIVDFYGKMDNNMKLETSYSKSDKDDSPDDDQQLNIVDDPFNFENVGLDESVSSYSLSAISVAPSSEQQHQSLKNVKANESQSSQSKSQHDENLLDDL